jgi:hypothetical protein
MKNGDGERKFNWEMQVPSPRLWTLVGSEERHVMLG